ncbi:MAG: hypothetical protein ACJ75B_20405 [Flavisolibacter sp.]
MDKETLLQTYIDIETKTYVRSDKTKKLNDLINAITISRFELTLPETLNIVNTLLYAKTTIRHPFFLYVIYPVLVKGIEGDDIQAIKQLITLFDYYGNFQNLTSDNKYTTWALLTKGLQLSPLDKDLLGIYERLQENYFDYTLHELPTGILYSADGATIEQCDELLNDLSDYEDVCKKLNVDRQELIKNCKLYYNSYKSYLSVYKSYNGFADYLEQHGIADK